MQTFLTGYPHLVERLSREKIVLLPELQEANGHFCDVGSVSSVLVFDPINDF